MFQNIFVLALLAPIVVCLITKAYDKFEKKDYPTKTYIQISTLSYISTLVVLYVSRMGCPVLGSCPWKDTSAKPSTSTPNVPNSSSNAPKASILETVVNKISQSGGSSNNPSVSTNNVGELFHTGTPTF
jgi:hypothetical protein